MTILCDEPESGGPVREEWGRVERVLDQKGQTPVDDSGLLRRFRLWLARVFGGAWRDPD